MKKNNNIDILFDSDLIRENIKDITKNKKLKTEELRNSVLVLLKTVILNSKKESEKYLFNHGSGTRCARSFSSFHAARVTSNKCNTNVLITTRRGELVN